MNQLLVGGITAQSLLNVVVNVALTFILAFIIALVYKKTHTGLSYSQSFVFTLVIMSIIVALVMMVIGNSLARAFGLLGAFSIIRFRTAVKDTKDTGFIFFALAVGMAVGTNNYQIAIVGTGLVLLVILLLNKINFGSIRNHAYLLSFVSQHGIDNGSSFEGVLKKYLKKSFLLNINSKRDGNASDMTYHITFFDEGQKQEFIKELSNVNGLEEVHLITSKEDVEY